MDLSFYASLKEFLVKSGYAITSGNPLVLKYVPNNLKLRNILIQRFRKKIEKIPLTIQ